MKKLNNLMKLTLKQKNNEKGIVTISNKTAPEVVINSIKPIVFGFSKNN